MQTYYKTIKEAMQETFPNVVISFIEADIDAALPLILDDR